MDLFVNAMIGLFNPITALLVLTMERFWKAIGIRILTEQSDNCVQLNWRWYFPLAVVIYAIWLSFVYGSFAVLLPEFGWRILSWRWPEFIITLFSAMLIAHLLHTPTGRNVTTFFHISLLLFLAVIFFVGQLFWLWGALGDGRP